MNAKRLTKCKTWKGMGVESSCYSKNINSNGKITRDEFISVNAFRRLKTCLYFILTFKCKFMLSLYMYMSDKIKQFEINKVYYNQICHDFIQYT